MESTTRTYDRGLLTNFSNASLAYNAISRHIVPCLTAAPHLWRRSCVVREQGCQLKLGKVDKRTPRLKAHTRTRRTSSRSAAPSGACGCAFNDADGGREGIRCDPSGFLSIFPARSAYAKLQRYRCSISSEARGVGYKGATYTTHWSPQDFLHEILASRSHRIRWRLLQLQLDDPIKRCCYSSRARDLEWEGGNELDFD
jgi:hypothetical protein